MRKILLAAIVVMGVPALSATTALAAPPSALSGLHAVPAHASVMKVDYFWRHHHYHHRRWEHNHWRYWD